MVDAVQQIRRVIKQYILDEFLFGAGPETLSDDTPLISGGLLDSIGIMKLVVFLEETHGVEFEAHEVSADRMDTLDGIVRVVRTKIGETA